jgi:quercetin dioxygenase-like cupin family protein
LEQPAKEIARTAPNDANGSQAVRLLFAKECDMIIAGWLRPHRVLVAVVAVATGALACRDTTTPRESSRAAITEPHFTLGVGFTSTPVGRGHLGTFHVQSKADGYDVELKSHDDTDIAVANIAIAAGGTSGWHKHPGPVLVVVKTGTLTFYYGDDPTCSPTVRPAGSSFVEEGGMVHIARNEGAVEATTVATYFAPKGAATRIDEPAPGNCAF